MTSQRAAWQPYPRVSTDDKGQRPERQEELMALWAEREGQTLLPSIRDVGTSATFTNPFDRPRFMEAVEAARRAGAAGIVAEKVDRVCGQGSDELGWVRFELRRKYDLRLAFADQPLSMLGKLSGNVTTTVDAEVRRERIATDRARIKSGIQTRAKKGLPIGGQTQAKVSPELVAAVLEVATENPKWGCRRIAREVSARRGAFAASLTAKEQRKRKVSYMTISRVLSQGKGRHTERNVRAGMHRHAGTSPSDAPGVDTDATTEGREPDVPLVPEVRTADGAGRGRPVSEHVQHAGGQVLDLQRGAPLEVAAAEQRGAADHDPRTAEGAPAEIDKNSGSGRNSIEKPPTRSAQREAAETALSGASAPSAGVPAGR